jgi:hypothetical protein
VPVSEEECYKATTTAAKPSAPIVPETPPAEIPSTGVLMMVIRQVTKTSHQLILMLVVERQRISLTLAATAMVAVLLAPMMTLTLVAVVAAVTSLATLTHYSKAMLLVLTAVARHSSAMTPVALAQTLVLHPQL